MLGSGVKSSEGVEASMRRGVVEIAEAKVPLAHNVGSVTKSFQAIGEQRSVPGEASRLPRLEGSLLSPDVVRIHPGQESASAGGAHLLDIILGQSDASGRDPRHSLGHIRHQLVVPADISKAKIIREYEHNVWPFLSIFQIANRGSTQEC